MLAAAVPLLLRGEGAGWELFTGAAEGVFAERGGDCLLDVSACVCVCHQQESHLQ